MPVPDRTVAEVLDPAVPDPIDLGGLPTDLLVDCYRHMLTARLLDAEAVALQRQGVFPAYVSLLGQEAAQVGSAAALDRGTDFVFPTYREMAVALAFGVDMVGYLASHRALWHGGYYDPVRSRFGAVNAVVGGPVPHAVGWALGERLRGGPGCAIAYFGDGASSEGDVHEAMNMAGVFRTPVVFFCQNNQWALSVPNHRQIAGGSVAARAAGYGMPGVVVDGNDVAAVYRATREALDRARSGGGPTLVEARTYRLAPHSTSDDAGRYRDAEEERYWRGRDPLPRLAHALRSAGLVGPDFFEAAERDARGRVTRIREGVASAPEPPGTDMFDHVFREPTPELLRQRAAWCEEERP
ncbi:thiamine pyrophosphate-dependent dehydrogenase E1 component subunit alpha [Marinitenerispora sediminis]|uniref:2-oxoisovalerate dehydrogenase subunit alpha n=1 Tax=Marinitenerispora sediminis TaxID=1931232 RepID=A0A368T9W0_9ACTN|nr:thiamine pyrophosphate-dependent enzyme [Marinitenerispora sediminis]RCV56847.1 pyruvate dehydrogenase [Marinitenerispora sediminis]RCV59022.1 pyruvate dehydrogenase [Marinitenerispora sediminis]RCV61556.1 pyruvate dehydrogenase [Marinitenerispora sediminis]